MQEDHGTEAVWERLRATRWDPPRGATASEARRETYVFALEQAEQMFRAAATVGTATRPLLVFYGLSQAGRSIAAAAASFGSGDGWKLNGHGISSVGLDRKLPDVEIHCGQPSKAGSFVRLSGILDSPLWGKSSVRLNELWDVLPENEQTPLLDTGDSRRTPLWIEHRNLYRVPHPLASVPVARFPPWVIAAADGRQALTEYLEAFPESRDYHGFRRNENGPDAGPVFDAHHDGWGELTMHWSVPIGQQGTQAERLALLETLTRRYDGRLYFFPAVGSTTRSLHPLMAWWAVIYTLSMLARYQPADWAAHINVDTSPHAVAIERILKEAIRTLPCLIAEAINQVEEL